MAFKLANEKIKIKTIKSKGKMNMKRNKSFGGASSEIM
jgi:hypothetical protein